MSTTRQHRSTDGGQNQPSDADDALSRLLANAAPPRHLRDGSRELRGEAEAAAAFRAEAAAAFREARLRPSPASRRRFLGAGKLLALKAAIAIAGLSGASAALAAVTGNLPGHLGGNSASPAASAPFAPGKGLVQASRLAVVPASPELRGLCNAYAGRAGSNAGRAGNNPGKALGNPAYARLVAAAGGEDKVPAYCSAVLAAPPPGQPAGHAGSRAGKPATHPTPHPSAGAGADSPAGAGTGSQGNSDTANSNTSGSGSGNSDANGSSTGNSSTSGSNSGGADSGQGSGNASSGPSGHPTGKPSLHP